MERVGIGTRIMTAIRLSREAEYFTVRSAGVFIHRLKWGLHRSCSSGTSTMILMISVTFAMGIILVIGTTLAIEAVLVKGSIMRLTTTITSTTVSTTGLAIPATAASVVFMEPKASADSKASVEGEALVALTQWGAKAFMVEQAVTAEH